MYCKNCGKEYPRKNKICKECQVALTPGTPPASESKGINKIAIIITSTIMLAVVALFLIVGLSGMVPADLKGTWYEQSGFGGILEFMPNGVLNFEILGEANEGVYDYNNSTGIGNLTMETEAEDTSEFTCDGVTIEMEGATFTRKEVEQFNFSEMLEGVVDELD